MSAMHEQGGMPIPDIQHINQPNWWSEGGDMTPEDFGRARAAELEEAIKQLGADRVAAFIAEPVQGSGRRDRCARHILARGTAHLRPLRYFADRR